MVDRELDFPEKIPDYILVKHLTLERGKLEVELGKKESYIQELEHKLSKITESKKSNLAWNNLNEKIRALEKKIKKLTKIDDKDPNHLEIERLRKRERTLEAEVVKLLKENNELKKSA